MKKFLEILGFVIVALVLFLLVINALTIGLRVYKQDLRVQLDECEQGMDKLWTEVGDLDILDCLGE